MKLFENKVGRPSNQTLKKRKMFKAFLMCFIVLFIGVITLTISKKDVNTSKGSVFDVFKSVFKSSMKSDDVSKTTTSLEKDEVNTGKINLYCDKYTYNVGDEIKCYTNAIKGENTISATKDGRDNEKTKFNYNKKIITLKYDTTGIKEIKIKDINGNVLIKKTITIVNNDVYDLVLFWGQSNMVGTSGRYSDEKIKKDVRDISGLVDYEIRKNYTKYSKVDVNISENVAYEYRLYDDEGNPNERLVSIKDGSNIGENLAYYKNDLYYQKWFNNQYNCSKNGTNYEDCSYYSIQQSRGTNMVPEFVKTYYEMTGRKLIVLFAAYDGSSISEFSKDHLGEKTVNGENYTYEAMKLKWDKAVNYLNNNGYNIENKFYVAMQGEENANNRTGMSMSELEDYYYKTYIKVHNNLKNNFRIKFGVLNETGRKIDGNSTYNSYAKIINNAQESLIKNNVDIIKGSSLAYNAFIKGYTQYFSDYVNGTNDNRVHLTSASLSQIGKESAKQAVYKIKSIKTDQAPHITYYSGTNSVSYLVQDGGGISDFKIKKQTDNNWRVEINPHSKSHSGSLESYLPNSGSLYHTSYAKDNIGNTIYKTIKIIKKTNNYDVDNSPNLSAIYNNNDSVYFMVNDESSVSKVYFYTNSDNLNEEKLYTYKYNKSGSLVTYAYFSVNINDFEYNDGTYYGYIKTCDKYDNCTNERLIIKK